MKKVLVTIGLAVLFCTNFDATAAYTSFKDAPVYHCNIQVLGKEYHSTVTNTTQYDEFKNEKDFYVYQSHYDKNSTLILTVPKTPEKDATAIINKNGNIIPVGTGKCVSLL